MSGCECVYLVILSCIHVVSLGVVLVMVLQAGFDFLSASRCFLSNLVACDSPCLPARKVMHASQHVYGVRFSFFLFGRGFVDGKQGRVVIMELRMRQRRLPAVARRQQAAVARGR